MNDDRGVLGLYCDGLIGMDDPRFMMRAEARMSASRAAQDGLSLEQTLALVRQRVWDLFGEPLQPLVDASTTTTWLEVKAAMGGLDEQC
jgi:hypothetical protein